MNARARETARTWQHAKYNSGVCPTCNAKHDDINPSTGKRYWRCRQCGVDHADESRAYYARKKERTV